MLKAKKAAYHTLISPILTSLGQRKTTRSCVLRFRTTTSRIGLTSHGAYVGRWTIANGGIVKSLRIGICGGVDTLMLGFQGI
jgi:hypothetical protein